MTLWYIIVGSETIIMVSNAMLLSRNEWLPRMSYSFSWSDQKLYILLSISQVTKLDN